MSSLCIYKRVQEHPMSPIKRCPSMLQTRLSSVGEISSLTTFGRVSLSWEGRQNRSTCFSGFFSDRLEEGKAEWNATGSWGVDMIWGGTHVQTGYVCRYSKRRKKITVGSVRMLYSTACLYYEPMQSFGERDVVSPHILICDEKLIRFAEFSGHHPVCGLHWRLSL